MPRFNGLLHVRGAVGMARAQDLNSANSQFYIMFVPRLQMDRNYTVFGRVVGGMNFVDSIERGEPPAAPSRILRASLGSDNVPPMTAEQIQAERARSPPRPSPWRPGSPRRGPGRAADRRLPPARAGPRRRRSPGAGAAERARAAACASTFSTSTFRPTGSR